jgi:hypothetical protein
MRRPLDRPGKSWSAKLPSPPVTIGFTKAAECFSLAITGQPQNDRNDLAGYYSNHT